jgi:tetratricopeptide (TPR) repeat protein
MESKQRIQDLPLEQQQKIASCREAVLRAPDDPQAHIELAKAYLAADKAELALGELEIAAQLQPGSASIHHNLGYIHHYLGQDELAEKAFRRALECDAKFYQASLALAWLLERRRSLDEAIQIIEESLQHSPDSEDLYDALGWLYYKRRDREHAIQVFEEGLRILPESYGLHISVGALYREIGDYDRSLAVLHAAAQIDPANAEAYSGIARTLLALQRFDEAEKEIRQALQIDPEDVDGLHYLGWILRAQERYSEAIQVLEEAIALEPSQPKSYCELAHVFRDVGEPERALAVIRGGLAVFEEHAFLYREMADVYSDLGESERALEASARAVELAPTDLYTTPENELGLRTYHGALLGDEGRLEEAIRQYAHVLAVKPDYELALIMLTGSLAQLGFRGYVDDQDVTRIITPGCEPAWRGSTEIAITKPPLETEQPFSGDNREVEEYQEISELIQEEVTKQLELHRHEVVMQQRLAYAEALALPTITGYVGQWLEDTAVTGRRSKEIADQLRVIAARNDAIARYIFDSCRRYWFGQAQGSPGHNLLFDLEKPPRILVEFGERVRLLRQYVECFHAPGYRWGEDNLEYLRRYFDSIGFVIPDHALNTLYAIREVSNDFGRHVTNVQNLTLHLQTLELSYPLEENPEAIHRAYLKVLRKMAAAMRDILDVTLEAANTGVLQ